MVFLDSTRCKCALAVVSMRQREMLMDLTPYDLIKAAATDADLVLIEISERKRVVGRAKAPLSRDQSPLSCIFGSTTSPISFPSKVNLHIPQMQAQTIIYPCICSGPTSSLHLLAFLRLNFSILTYLGLSQKEIRRLPRRYSSMAGTTLCGQS